MNATYFENNNKQFLEKENQMSVIRNNDKKIVQQKNEGQGRMQNIFKGIGKQSEGDVSNCVTSVIFKSFN